MSGTGLGSTYDEARGRSEEMAAPSVLNEPVADLPGQVIGALEKAVAYYGERAARIQEERDRCMNHADNLARELENMHSQRIRAQEAYDSYVGKAKPVKNSGMIEPRSY